MWYHRYLWLSSFSFSFIFLYKFNIEVVSLAAHKTPTDSSFPSNCHLIFIDRMLPCLLLTEFFLSSLYFVFIFFPFFFFFDSSWLALIHNIPACSILILSSSQLSSYSYLQPLMAELKLIGLFKPLMNNTSSFSVGLCSIIH